MENSMEVPQKNRATRRSSNPTPGHRFTENCNSKRYMHPNVHPTAAPLTQVKTKRQHECLQTDGRVNMWCKYIQYRELYHSLGPSGNMAHRQMDG